MTRYPSAEVIETVIEVDEDNFQAQKNKSLQRNAEGASIGVVLLGRSAVVLVRRLALNPGWALPGGTVESNEEFDDAFLRELEEETSLKARIERLLLLENRVFESPAGETHQVNLAVFEAAAHPGQIPVTTELAAKEDLEVGTFNLDSIPLTMIFKDRDRLLRVISDIRRTREDI